MNVYRLMENLLDWANAQSENITFPPSEIDLRTLVGNEVNTLSSNAQIKGISLKNNVEKSAKIFADQHMIRSVIQNLISNAIKFTSSGGEVAIESMSDNRVVQITVSDTGVGIPKEKLDKLFQLEFASSTQGTNREKGSGLGLLLCKDFLERHGGKLWVESEVDRGSKFFFTLPNSLLK